MNEATKEELLETELTLDIAIGKKFAIAIKRVIDFLLAFVLIIILSPLFIGLAIAIKLDSKGPVFFTQNRAGKNGKIFKMYKFRSCSADNNVYDTSKEDEITRVGRFIRKTSIDELGQFINILKGDMSFIGPRPWIPEYNKYFTRKQKRRVAVLPGITGLAQCSGRNNINIIERINYDVEYVDNLSLKLDLKVIYRTIKSVFKKEGADNSNKSTIQEEFRLLKANFERESAFIKED